MRKKALIVSNGNLIPGVLDQELSGDFDLDRVKNAEEALDALAADGRIGAVIVDCNLGQEKRETRFFARLRKSVPELLRIAIVEPSGLEPLLSGGLSSAIVTKPWTFGDFARILSGQGPGAGAPGKRKSPAAAKSGLSGKSIQSAFQKGFDLYANLFEAINPMTQLKKEKGNMAYDEKWMGGVMDMTRMSMETGMQGLESLQNQAERAIEMTIANVNLVQEETNKALNNWLDTAKQVRKLYTNALEEGLGNLQQNYAAQKGTSKTK